MRKLVFLTLAFLTVQYNYADPGIINAVLGLPGKTQSSDSASLIVNGSLSTSVDTNNNASQGIGMLGFNARKRDTSFELLIKPPVGTDSVGDSSKSAAENARLFGSTLLNATYSSGLYATAFVEHLNTWWSSIDYWKTLGVDGRLDVGQVSWSSSDYSVEFYKFGVTLAVSLKIYEQSFGTADKEAASVESFGYLGWTHRSLLGDIGFSKYDGLSNTILGSNSRALNGLVGGAKINVTDSALAFIDFVYFPGNVDSNLFNGRFEAGVSLKGDIFRF
jgi:hypothetical protein